MVVASVLVTIAMVNLECLVLRQTWLGLVGWIGWWIFGQIFLLAKNKKPNSTIKIKPYFFSQVNWPSKVCDFMTYWFFLYPTWICHKWCSESWRQAAVSLSFKHIFSCGMFKNPHLSVHPQSIQSGESKFFLTPKFCKHARSMRALYGWISMNECLGARKSLKRTWWVEMTLKYSSKKKINICRFPGSPCFWNLF